MMGQIHPYSGERDTEKDRGHGTSISAVVLGVCGYNLLNLVVACPQWENYELLMSSYLISTPLAACLEHPSDWKYVNIYHRMVP